MDAWSALGWQAWTCLGTLVGALVLLFSGRVGGDAVLLVALAFLVLIGAVDAASAFAGFANEGLLTIAALLVVARGLEASGAMQLASRLLLRRSGGEGAALMQLLPPVALGSAVFNNTPLVALLIPRLSDWCRRRGFAPGRFLLPLSYAAILGGLLTMIGTSTNLVVAGMLESAGWERLGIFAITPLGIAVLLAGMCYLLFVAPLLLPRSKGGDRPESRSFTSQREVEAHGPLVGRAVSELHDDHGQALLPVEIRRGTEVIPAPSPDARLQAGDLLSFSGPSAALLGVHACPGLGAVDIDQTPLPGSRRVQVHEVVIDATCPLIGQQVGNGGFRARYDAAVLALSRAGDEVDARRDGWRLQAGDLLLIEARPGFIDRHGRGDGLWVVASHQPLQAGTAPRAMLGLALLLLMVLVAAIDIGPLARIGMFEAALGTGALLLLGGFMKMADARRSLDRHLLLVIACALGLGTALAQTGVAAALAGSLIDLAGDRPLLCLAAIYVATTILTECITNSAAAALMVPIALSLGERLGVAPQAFVFTIMVAASASFVTPLGYQTNLMVLGPGRYRYADFLRVGLPLTLLCATVTLLLAPMIWPFQK